MGKVLDREWRPACDGPMGRRFNIAGPCKPDLRYMLPPLRRLPGLRALIDGQSAFVVHAPRQTGKTTAIRQLAAELMSEGRHAAAVLSAEVGEPYPEPGDAEQAVNADWVSSVEQQLPVELHPPPWPDVAPGALVVTGLRRWAASCPRPLVLFLDEVDSLQPHVLSSLLKQLQSGIPGRPAAFPWALALVGMRDVRDYVLARIDEQGSLRIADPIHAETVPRVLAATTQRMLPPGPVRDGRPAWLDAAGRLDERVLPDALVGFWCQHAEPLMWAAPYHEIAPHLVLMASSGRVAKRRGRVEREYAVGSRRMDLCLTLGWEHARDGAQGLETGASGSPRRGPGTDRDLPPGLGARLPLAGRVRPALGRTARRGACRDRADAHARRALRRRREGMILAGRGHADLASQAAPTVR
ncbi:MAG: hypothetical protein AMXMBFR64_58390 [Myxococcales bacterium]